MIMLPRSRCCDYICETRGSSIRTAKSPFIRPQCGGAQHGMIALSPIHDPGRYVMAGMPYPDLRPAGHDFQGKDVMRRLATGPTYLGTRGRSAIAQSNPLEGGDIAVEVAGPVQGHLRPGRRDGSVGHAALSGQPPKPGGGTPFGVPGLTVKARTKR
jgi:hypothetical protein